MVVTSVSPESSATTLPPGRIRFWTVARRVACVLFACFFVYLTLMWRDGPLLYDEAEYSAGSAYMVSDGVLSPWPGLGSRAWGYPWFLSLVRRVLSPMSLTRTPVAIAQLLIYTAMAWFASRRLGRAMGSIFRGPMFELLCVNIFVLAYVHNVLTETLAVSFALLLGAILLPWVSEPRHPWRTAGLLGLTTGALVAVRQANICWIPPVVLVYAVVQWNSALPRSRWKAPLGSLVILAGVLLVTTPQMLANSKAFDRIWPLPMGDMTTMHLKLGKEWMKYGTDTTRGALWFTNPFYNGDIEGRAPWKWYLRRPSRSVPTLLIKAFNLLDTHLLFQYNDIKESAVYRWPVSLLNHMALFFGGLGVVQAWRQGTRAERRVVASFLTLAVCFIGMHTLALVDARFGLPLLTLLILFVPRGWQALTSASPATRRSYAMIGAAYIVSALILSGYVESQMVIMS